MGLELAASAGNSEIGPISFLAFMYARVSRGSRGSGDEIVRGLGANPKLRMSLVSYFQEISKMATAERREARRRKLLQNPEDRLKKILGSRQSHASTPHSQLEPDEDVPKSISAKNGIVNAEMELVVTDTEGRENKVITGEKEVEKGFGVDDQTNVTETPSICDLKDLERERDTEMERRQSLEKESKLLPDETSSTSLQGAALSPPRDIQTVENERSSLQSKRWRVVFNVVLAFVFVSKWTYVNLEVLLCTADKQALDDSHRILIHSEVRKKLRVGFITHNMFGCVSILHKAV